MPKPVKERTQEFLNALKDELKKPNPQKDIRLERMLDKMKTTGRKLPPGAVISRLSRLNKLSQVPQETETWIGMARTIYDMWLAENYPDDVPE